jgi:hypothetical protein
MVFFCFVFAASVLDINVCPWRGFFAIITSYKAEAEMITLLSLSIASFEELLTMHFSCLRPQDVSRPVTESLTPC